MYSHAPKEYKCPICLGIKGIENEDTLLKQADLIYKDDLVSAFINSFWIGKNEGHVIVVPNEHYENLYDLPKEYIHKISEITQKISLGMKKSYNCDGITVRQNNEPASEQHAFHYHQHIFPRYEGDEFNKKLTEKSRLSEPNERIVYAQKIKDEI